MSTAKERREVYSSRRWQKLRSAKLDDQPLCENCERNGLVIGATVVHHKIAIRDGGDPFPELDGLEALCWVCHQDEHLHSQRERAEVDPVDRMTDAQKKLSARLESLYQ